VITPQKKRICDGRRKGLSKDEVWCASLLVSNIDHYLEANDGYSVPYSLLLATMRGASGVEEGRYGAVLHEVAEMYRKVGWSVRDRINPQGDLEYLFFTPLDEETP